MSPIRLVFAAGTLLMGCADPDELAPSARPAPAGATVVGRVQTRDRVLTLHATGSGPRLTLATRGGAIIARDVSPAELDRHDPELAAVYRRSVAAGVEPVLDARLDPEVRAAGRAVLDKSDVGMHMPTR